MASLDKVLQDVVAQEVARAIAPINAQLSKQTDVINRLAAAFGAAPIKRGPGRPPKALSLSAAAPTARRKPGPKPRNTGGRACAIEGCPKDARSKGYCAAHYQKFRNLEKTGRLPADWVADAAPQSVQNIKLKRGRAGARELAEARKKK